MFGVALLVTTLWRSYFIDGNLTGTKYRTFLQWTLPSLLEGILLRDRLSMWYQQDVLQHTILAKCVMFSTENFLVGGLVVLLAIMACTFSGPLAPRLFPLGNSKWHCILQLQKRCSNAKYRLVRPFSWQQFRQQYSLSGNAFDCVDVKHFMWL